MPEAASDLRQGACGLEAEAVLQSRLSRQKTQAATRQEAEATLAAPRAERLPRAEGVGQSWSLGAHRLPGRAFCCAPLWSPREDSWREINTYEVGRGLPPPPPSD